MALGQIAELAAEGMAATEKELLLQLQGHAFDSKLREKQKVFQIWISLWLLILTYHSTLSAYEVMGVDNTPCQLAQHMYNMIISIYSGLFRTSSPLWVNWFKAEMYKSVVSDHEITRSIGIVKTEVALYGKACNVPYL
jgi:hypothetical protein